MVKSIHTGRGGEAREVVVGPTGSQNCRRVRRGGEAVNTAVCRTAIRRFESDSRLKAYNFSTEQPFVGSNPIRASSSFQIGTVSGKIGI